MSTSVLNWINLVFLSQIFLIGSAPGLCQGQMGWEKSESTKKLIIIIVEHLSRAPSNFDVKRHENEKSENEKKKWNPMLKDL